MSYRMTEFPRQEPHVARSMTGVRLTTDEMAHIFNTKRIPEPTDSRARSPLGTFHGECEDVQAWRVRQATKLPRPSEVAQAEAPEMSLAPSDLPDMWTPYEGILSLYMKMHVCVYSICAYIMCVCMYDGSASCLAVPLSVFLALSSSRSQQVPTPQDTASAPIPSVLRHVALSPPSPLSHAAGHLSSQCLDHGSRTQRSYLGTHTRIPAACVIAFTIQSGE